MSELIQILNLSIIFCLSVPISHFSSDFLLQYWGNVRDLGYIYLMFGNAPSQVLDHSRPRLNARVQL